MSLFDCYTKEDEALEKLLEEQNKEKREFPHPKNVFAVSRRTTLDLSRTTQRYKKSKKQTYDPCMVSRRGGVL